MHKSHGKRIWVKAVALLIIGVLLFTQNAYARHCIKDHSLDDFFKSDAADAALYVVGLALTAVAPYIGPAIGIGTEVTSTGIIISGAVNVGSQLAVAAGANPKLVAVAGALGGGIANGISNFSAATTAAQSLSASTGMVIQSPSLLSCLAVSTIPSLATTGASMYAGEKNPMLGQIAGLGAGLVASVGAQQLVGGHWTANGKSISEFDLAKINNGLDIAKQVPVSTNNYEFRDPAAVEGFLRSGGSLTDIPPIDYNGSWGTYQPPTTEVPIDKGSFDGLLVKYPDLQNLSASKLAQVQEANQIILTKGDVWRSATGKPIVDYSFPLATLEDFRAISPGQWTSLVVSAAAYQALAGDSKDPNKRILANAVGSFTGDVLGSLVNQSSFARGWAYAGTEYKDKIIKENTIIGQPDSGLRAYENVRSPWYNQNFNLGKIVMLSAVDASVEYGVDRLTVNSNLSPMVNNFLTGGAKFLAGNLISSPINAIFNTPEEKKQQMQSVSLGLEKSPSLPGGIPEPQYTQIRVGIAEDSVVDISWKQFKNGLLNAAYVFPVPTPSVGRDAGYNAIMYDLSVVQRFGTGADFFTTVANNFGSNLGSIGSAQIKSAVTDAFYQRSFWGDFDAATKKKLADLRIDQNKASQVFADEWYRNYLIESNLLSVAVDGSVGLPEINTLKFVFPEEDRTSPGELQPFRFTSLDLYGARSFNFTGSVPNQFIRGAFNAELIGVAKDIYPKAIELWKKDYTSPDASVPGYGFAPGYGAGAEPEDIAKTTEDFYNLPLKEQKQYLRLAIAELVPDLAGKKAMLDQYVDFTEQKINGQIILVPTLATEQNRQDFKQELSQYLTGLASRSVGALKADQIEVKSAEELWGKGNVEKDTLDSFWVIRKDMYLLDTIGVSDRWGRQMYSFAYNHLDPQVFNVHEQHYLERFEKKFIELGDLPKDSPQKVFEETFGLKAQKTPPKMTMWSLMDPNNVIGYDELSLKRASVNYFGYGGMPILVDTTLLRQPIAASNPAAKDAIQPTINLAKEQVYYSYDNFEPNRYLKILDASGTIPVGPKFPVKPELLPKLEGYVKNELAAGYATATDRIAKIASLTSICDDLLNKGIITPENKQAVLETAIGKTGAAGTLTGGVTTANPDEAYKLLLETAAKSYFLPQAMQQYQTYELGFFAYDYANNKRAMLPEISQKFGFRQDRSKWAEEPSAYIYKGLSRIDRDAQGERIAPTLAINGNSINTFILGDPGDEIGKSGGVPVILKTTTDKEITDIAGYQILEKDGEYTAVRQGQFSIFAGGVSSPVYSSGDTYSDRRVILPFIEAKEIEEGLKSAKEKVDDSVKKTIEAGISVPPYGGVGSSRLTR